METIEYGLFDGRYPTNPDRAICFEVCETLEEARENRLGWGDDTVIVKMVINEEGVIIEKEVI